MVHYSGPSVKTAIMTTSLPYLSLCFFSLWVAILKGQCHEIFCFWFFSSTSFPPAPEYPIRTVSNFFENSRRYLQVKVHHRYQQHRWQICHRCQRHWRQNCRRYQRHRRQIATGINVTGGKFCHQFCQCCWYRWQNFYWCQRYRRQICRRCQRHRWQFATGINDTSGKFATRVNDTGGK